RIHEDPGRRPARFVLPVPQIARKFAHVADQIMNGPARQLEPIATLWRRDRADGQRPPGRCLRSARRAERGEDTPPRSPEDRVVARRIVFAPHVQPPLERARHVLELRLRRQIAASRLAKGLCVLPRHAVDRQVLAPHRHRRVRAEVLEGGAGRAAAPEVLGLVARRADAPDRDLRRVDEERRHDHEAQPVRGVPRPFAGQLRVSHPERAARDADLPQRSAPRARLALRARPGADARRAESDVRRLDGSVARSGYMRSRTRYPGAPGAAGTPNDTSSWRNRSASSANPREQPVQGSIAPGSKTSTRSVSKSGIGSERPTLWPGGGGTGASVSMWSSTCPRAGSSGGSHAPAASAAAR